MAKLNLRNPPHLPLIFPSILAADFARLGEDVGRMLALGADGMHIDVMDGHFVDNLTMGPIVVQALRRMFPELYLDVHLMVREPASFIGSFAQAGADHITFHIEAVMGRDKGHELDVIRQVRDAGCTAGIALNPSTPGAAVEHLLGDIDMLLVMSVHPGFGGQSFRPQVLPKTRWLKDRLPPTVRLEMDGGLGEKTIAAARQAGVDAIVAGSALFGAADKPAAMKALRGE